MACTVAIGVLASILLNEYLLPDTMALSKKTLKFPYAITVPRIFTYRRVYSGLANVLVPVKPWYSGLYEAGHPSQALALTGEIIKLFASTASEREKTPLVFLLPSAREILYYQNRGEWIYQELMSTIKEAGIPVYNLGEHLLALLDDTANEYAAPENMCDLFCTKPIIKGGHYTERGNSLLAEAAFRVLAPLISAQRSLDSSLKTMSSGHSDGNGLKLDFKDG